MSDAFEDFLVIFEATTPALRSRVMDMILAEAGPDPEADFDELATEAGISPGQRERIRRAVDEAFAYRAAQNAALVDAVEVIKAFAYGAAQND